MRGPRHLLRDARDRLQASGALSFAGLEPAPATPLNVKVGPHRRYTWVDAELSELRAIKNSLGGTVNDAILAVVAGALGRYLRHRCVDTRDLVLKALVPISVRAEDSEHGNVVAPLEAPLPVGIEDPVEQYRAIRDSASVARRHARGRRRAHAHRARRLRLADDHEPGRAPAAEPALLQPRRDERARPAGPAVPARAAAARAVPGRPDHRPPGARDRGHELRRAPGFGLLADYDALADVDVLATELRDAIDALAAGASIPRRAARGRRKAKARPSATSTVSESVLRSPDGSPAVRRVAVAIAGLVVAAAGVIAVIALLNARDDATLDDPPGPASRASAGARPVVAPGNVVLLYSDERLTAGAARARARHRRARHPRAGGRRAGRARRPPARPAHPRRGLTTDRRLDARGADDPRLRAFIEYWLGRQGEPP